MVEAGMAEQAQVLEAAIGGLGFAGANSFVDATGAVCLAAAGDADAARERLRRVPTDAPALTIEYALMALMAGAAARLAERQLAGLMLARLSPLRDRLASFGMAGAVCLGPMSLWLGIAARATGDDAQAEGHLRQAVDQSARLHLLPFLARARFELAALLEARGTMEAGAEALTLRREAAVVARDLDMPELLRRIGDEPAQLPAGPEAPPFDLRLEGDFWTLISGGQVTRLKDSKGLRMLAELVANPDQERHVLALMGAAGDEGEPSDTGDAGELLDGKAIADYRQRVQDLDDELADAERLGDLGRTQKARAELEALTSELSRGVGLGGRRRHAASAVERARTNVQRRLRGAIRRIEEVNPTLGRHLGWAVRTGTFCVYSPGGPRR
jgi:hypothetical protein